MKPNVFEYARGELAQDAIICYILKHYFLECEEAVVARRMLKGLMCGTSLKGLKDFDIKRQARFVYLKKTLYIDILLCLKFENEEKYLIIEDKVESKEYKAQISRYKAAVLKAYGKKAQAVYFKTQPECKKEIKRLEDEGVYIYTRKDLLTCFDEVMLDDILSQFYSYHRANEDALAKAWLGVPRDANDIRAFFMKMDESMKEAGYWEVLGQRGFYSVQAGQIYAELVGRVGYEYKIKLRIITSKKDSKEAREEAFLGIKDKYAVSRDGVNVRSRGKVKCTFARLECECATPQDAVRALEGMVG